MNVDVRIESIIIYEYMSIIIFINIDSASN